MYVSCRSSVRRRQILPRTFVGPQDRKGALPTCSVGIADVQLPRFYGRASPRDLSIQLRADQAARHDDAVLRFSVTFAGVRTGDTAKPMYVAVIGVEDPEPRLRLHAKSTQPRCAGCQDLHRYLSTLNRPMVVIVHLRTMIVCAVVIPFHVLISKNVLR
jgi:hypothetical protein